MSERETDKVTEAHESDDHAAREYDAGCDACQQTALDNARELSDDLATQNAYLRSVGMGALALGY